MGTHPRVFSESYPMNANMTGFNGFHKSLRSCALGESNLSIQRDIYDDVKEIIVLHIFILF